jgi:hypothetical protein
LKWSDACEFVLVIFGVIVVVVEKAGCYGLNYGKGGHPNKIF